MHLFELLLILLVLYAAEKHREFSLIMFVLNIRLVQVCSYILKLVFLFNRPVLMQCKEILNTEGHFEFSK